MYYHASTKGQHEITAGTFDGIWRWPKDILDNLVDRPCDDTAEPSAAERMNGGIVQEYIGASGNTVPRIHWSLNQHCCVCRTDMQHRHTVVRQIGRHTAGGGELSFFLIRSQIRQKTQGRGSGRHGSARTWHFIEYPSIEYPISYRVYSL